MARSYRSALRDEQARATRRSVVAAAAGLFVRDGYAATTLDAVAAAAGVSRRTVVNAAGGKPALLALAVDHTLVGDDEPVPMADRPMVRRIVACTAPAEAVRLWADMVVDVQGRVAALAAVVDAAADTDPEVGALRARGERERLDGARAFAAHLDSLGGLRPDLSPDTAADVCWTLNDGASYRRLLGLRGWSAVAYRDWLTRVTTASLLA
ncbi:Transcriptional regulator, TetR family [Pseudonocardia sp. Ae168_Ps1]|uniref:TetR/AcrR family transcriptional regulator n=1 Tax=unclassified Pseudonocardia TaxID=2619320 RepID=UPI00094AD54D|nr:MULTISPECIES: helix-turn-helix domain-containing protein [unclassified Pseudonocardia]OLL71069.1 Transcriptional regulator, TetR family [Pseudonocardia sp. Ae168_Ps1]OLL77381.1 Transcriptional regulator, TetR family [Pseudonocardia sp. Ae150A_Ps1]OLL88507.1 Transcriptional regulator, TetR family [Pseudonocardia sp. Ae263_Ps1]OLL91470.1 Transcriptional regulator, TetR family [Pseudonocardia sp. Ae356_Ps1]